jgi:hypothetical protein
MAPKSETKMSAAHVPQLSIQQTDPIAQRALEMKYSRLTQELLGDADAGRVVSHQACGTGPKASSPTGLRQSGFSSALAFARQPAILGAK